jgi:transketolase
MNLQPEPTLSRRMADALRMLSADAVEQAKSGHPGAPMGMAEMAEVVWHRHLRHHPGEPRWLDRDRFVLSNGHASMLLYSLLHLSGYDLPLTELQNFRRLHSKTPGHPEVGVTPGVETTTGPLGQGLANAVGMALAEKLLAAEFNRPGHSIVDHHTWAFVGDGCLMEGISHEVGSFAGTLRLSRLIVLYDDNGISIDGDVKGWFTDNTAQRFRAYSWHVIDAVDGHDARALDAAVRTAKAQSLLADGKPTLIVCRTVIGHGAPNKAGGHDVHGAPLGAVELKATREALGWNEGPFEIPSELQQAWNATGRGAVLMRDWSDRFAAYASAHPELAAELQRRFDGDLPADFTTHCSQVFERIASEAKPVATRRASQLALDAYAPLLPELFGGSADLTGSNLTAFEGHRTAGRDRHGNHLSYGVREFGMAALMNGMALHGGLIPYGGTFLTFSDYSRNAIRMAALMKLRVIHVFTHDSIGLGEDGPTHQSIEHVPSLRLIPNLDVWRPADTLETAVAWVHALAREDGPSALALSRQTLPVAAKDASMAAGIARGGYVLSDAANAQVVIIGTGSELGLALQAQKLLAENGVAVRVVSMPSTSVFDRQDAAYREKVLPRCLPAVAVEAAHPDFWRKYVGREGAVVGIATFGESAPAADLFQHFGFSAEHVAQVVQQCLAEAAVMAE